MRIKLDRWVAQLLMALVRLYQWTLSPYIGGQCRFYPTCSHYAHQCLAQHGAWRGIGLILRRLGRCHPFSAGGVDPVPAAKTTHICD